MSHFQGFNVETYILPGGRIQNYTRVKLSLGQLWDQKNGYRVYKAGQATGEVEGKGKLIYSLLRPLAVIGGSWQKIKPVPGMAIYLNDDDGGEALHFALENVAIALPEDFDFAKIEGSEDKQVFKFSVLGQVFAGGVPVYHHLEETGGF